MLVGRSKVDATGHDGLMGRADDACVVSATTWQAVVAFEDCISPSMQIGLRLRRLGVSGWRGGRGPVRMTYAEVGEGADLQGACTERVAQKCRKNLRRSGVVAQLRDGVMG